MLQRMHSSQKNSTKDEKTLLRSILTVAASGALAQVLTLCCTPLITRLYGPSTIGIFGLFSAITSILTPIASLTYPLAIPLSPNKRDVIALIQISGLTAITSSAACTLIILTWGKTLDMYFPQTHLGSSILLIPVAMIASTLGSISTNYIARTQRFNIITKNSIQQAVINNTAKISFGYIHPAPMVLIATSALHGLTLSTLTYINLQRHDRNFLRLTLLRLNPIQRLKQTALKYKAFATYRMPQTLISTASFSLPPLILAALFGPEAVGSYSIVQLLLGAPANLAGNAVLQVLYPSLSRKIQAGNSSTKTIARMTIVLAAVAALPYASIVIGGSTIFTQILGEEWAQAGRYSNWLAVLFFFSFINKPAVSAIPPLKLEKELLIYEATSAITKTLAIYIAYNQTGDDLKAIAAFSATGSLFNSILIAGILKKSRKNDRHKI